MKEPLIKISLRRRQLNLILLQGATYCQSMNHKRLCGRGRGRACVMVWLFYPVMQMSTERAGGCCNHFNASSTIGRFQFLSILCYMPYQLMN